MLIRSQDKTKLIILDNIDGLFIRPIKAVDEVIDYKIDYLKNETFSFLGMFKTEQRASEVLDEIANIYQESEMYKAVGIALTQPQFVYQIPEYIDFQKMCEVTKND